MRDCCSGTPSEQSVSSLPLTSWFKPRFAVSDSGNVSFPLTLPAGGRSFSLGSQHQARGRQTFKGQTLKGRNVLHKLQSVYLNDQPRGLLVRLGTSGSCYCCSCQSPQGCSTDWTSILWCHPEASSDSESWSPTQNYCIRTFILTRFSPDYSFAP